MAKQTEFYVNVHINADVLLKVAASSIEDALHAAKSLKLAELLSDEVDSIEEGEIELTGIWE